MNYESLYRLLQSVYPASEARAMALWVMEARFGLSQTDVLLGKDSKLSANDLNELQNIAERLLKNEPIQYVLGQTEFCGLTLHVAPGVLIPRPETEELVGWIRETIQEKNNTKWKALDIGTGSGCIALALAAHGLQVEAWDVSEDALRIARKNAQRLGLNVQFRQQDMLNLASPTADLYGIIVSNPPYICQREAKAMEANVLDYEPSLALFVPDDDPLLFYRAIARFAYTHLAPGGHLFFEINRAYDQQTVSLLQSLGFTRVELRSDQFGNPRMIRASL